jgi:uncharacterized membrane protein YkoI
MKNQFTALINELFHKLNIKIDSIELNKEDDSNIFNIKIKTEDS